MPQAEQCLVDLIILDVLCGQFFASSSGSEDELCLLVLIVMIITVLIDSE